VSCAATATAPTPLRFCPQPDRLAALRRLAAPRWMARSRWPAQSAPPRPPGPRSSPCAGSRACPTRRSADVMTLHLLQHRPGTDADRRVWQPKLLYQLACCKMRGSENSDAIHRRYYNPPDHCMIGVRGHPAPGSRILGYLGLVAVVSSLAPKGTRLARLIGLTVQTFASKTG
jgi:hypothetical protein